VRFWYSEGLRPNPLHVTSVLRTAPKNAAVCVCGPPSLIQAVVDAANGLELPRSKLGYGRFSPIAPSSDDQAFEVRLKRSERFCPRAALGGIDGSEHRHYWAFAPCEPVRLTGGDRRRKLISASNPSAAPRLETERLSR
jgi:hypothetical protein